MKQKRKQAKARSRQWQPPKCDTPAKKPRTLNAVWADAQCWIYPDPETEHPHKMIDVQVQTRNLSARSALRLSKWLAEAAAWKGEG